MDLSAKDSEINGEEGGMVTESHIEQDSGFTLVEILVAMVIFTVIAGSVLGIMVKLGQTTGGNLRRSAASNLASQQIEAARNAKEADLPVGRKVTYPQVGKITYKVTQVISLADKNDSAKICSDAATVTKLAYKLVTVEVTWDGMGNLKPVRADTLRGIDTYAAGSGVTLAVQVSGADGPVDDAKVTLTVPTGQTPRNTGSDGCTTFTGVTGTSSNFTVARDGYVSEKNVNLLAGTQALSDPTLQRTTVTYAAGRSAEVALDVPPGSTVFTTPSLRYYGGQIATETTLPACTSASTDACATGLAGTVRNFYPNNYTLKAGNCAETDASQVSVAMTGPVDTVPTAAIPLGAISVTVKDFQGNPVVGRQVSFVHTGVTGNCGEPVYTTTTNATGSVPVPALPYGAWTVTTTSSSTPTPTPTPTASASPTPTPSPTPTMVLTGNPVISSAQRTATVALVVAS